MFKQFAILACAMLFAGCATGMPTRIPSYSSLMPSGGVPPQHEPDIDSEELADIAAGEGEDAWPE